jgi:RimJ/RimL family protein N-acetyltransferase
LNAQSNATVLSERDDLLGTEREVNAMIRAPEMLHTRRLLLRPVAEQDAAAIFSGYATDERATMFMNFSRHRDLDEAVAFVDRCLRCWQNGSAFPWAIIVTETAEFAGSIELRLNPPKADFGYIICSPLWGRGYAIKAASAVVSWAVAEPSIFRVWATCHPANAASARVLEKAGLKFEARLANWEARPNIGEPANDSLVYAITSRPQ